MIGISIGSLNSSISYYDRNQVKILLSETSNRTLPSLISITKNERIFGDNALFNIKSNLNNSLLGPHRYLSRSSVVINIEVENGIPNKNYFYNENSAFYCMDIKNSDRPDINGVYTATSMLSAFLTKINNYISYTNPKSHIYTLSCPDYFDLHERNRYLDAIRVSDISSIISNLQKEFYLLNESSAITLFYGYDRRKELKIKESRTVCFVDMGYSKTSVIISSFSQFEFNVHFVMSNRNLGCRNIDKRISEFLIAEFEAKNSIKVDKSAKTLYKLNEAVSQARKILTANQEALISIDSFEKDIDLNAKLSRSEMEKIIEREVEAYKKLLACSLEKFRASNSNLLNFHSVEMVGDAVRIPIIQQVTEEIIKMKLSKTIAPDECIAKGLCLYSLTQSKVVTKDYNFSLRHISSFDVNMKLTILRDGSQSSAGLHDINYTLLKIGNHFPTQKIFKISNLSEILEFEFYSSELLVSKLSNLLN